MPGLDRARAHLHGEDDELARGRPFLGLLRNCAAYLAEHDATGIADQLDRHARTDRRLGSIAFLADVETRLGRALRAMKPGPKFARGDTRTRDLLSDPGGE
jgi:hypothetical protein